VIKKIIGAILLVAGVVLLGFILWAFLPDRYGVAPHATGREVQAGVELGILAVVLLVSGVLLLLLSRRKKIKGSGEAEDNTQAWKTNGSRASDKE